jgi:hypothetical protein
MRKDLNLGKIKLTGSLVVYHNSVYDIKKVITSFLGYENDSILFIIDNSSNDSLSQWCDDSRIIYIFNNSNIGFGAAHNLAFKEAYKLNSTYHILLNPDIHFNPSIIKKLIDKMNSDTSIGLIMPKICYPDGSTQHLCKLIPTPIDLILRRFITNKALLKKITNRYELRFISYQEEAEIPVLSGCFMFVKTEVLKEIGGFDERFFMYLEDVDLCRRVNETSKLVYYPKVKVVHNYEKGSYKNSRLLKYHVKSAFKYFNKWGWFLDNKRKIINKRTLQDLKYYKN